MKSICIKATNSKTTEYLLEKLNKYELDEVYFSCKKFKFYQNVIIHFKGENVTQFIKKLSKTLTYLIIELYEELIIQNLIKSEYFYFDNFEQIQITSGTLEDLYNDEALILPKKRFNLIYKEIYNYILANHSIVLKGFITFRIKNYLEALLEQIDKSVNKYIIQKEYTEFISILKLYVNSEPSSCNIVHLIYNNSKPVLLDENKNIIKIEDDEILHAKYLSDISFSSNDFALNTLLNLVPKKIYIHLIDEIKDEFINTISLIFENRVAFCTECSICRLYKRSHAIKN